MEATILTISSPSSSSNSLTLKSHFCNPFITPKRALKLPHQPSKTRTLTIRATITRTKKESIIETVKQQLEDCYLIAGISYKGLTVKQFRDLRAQLPETSKLIVAKNTLVYKALEGTPWEALKPCMNGMNAWLFVHSEEIPAALEPYRTFQKEEKLEANDFSGAVFEGKFYGPDEIEALVNLPSRAEVYAKLLGTIKGPATAVVGTLQSPARNLVMVLQAYVKKLEEEGGQ